MSLARVAKHAGVSTATVCRVLRQAELVRPETVSQVREAMRAIGFVPPPPRMTTRKQRATVAAARGARAATDDDRDARARRIALVTLGHGALKYWLMVPSIASFVAALTAAARELDTDVLLDEMPDPSQPCRLIRRREIGGAVLLVHSDLARTEAGTDALRALARAVPVVWAMGGQIGPAVVDHVAPDNLGIGHLAGTHLLGQGCRRLGLVTTVPNWPFVRCRAAGFASAAHDGGADLVTYVVGDDPRAANVFPGEVRVVGSLAEATAALAGEAPGRRPDGIFTPTDAEMALLHPQLAAAGLRPQHDVRLVSCDNDPGLRGLLAPAPATIDLNTAEVADRAVRRLRLRMRHPSDPPALIQIPPVLVAPGAPAGTPVG